MLGRALLTKDPKLSKTRLEFLFDGIFAISMTILVLELKIPEIENRLSSHELRLALLHNGRIFFSYFLSFATLGGFWLLHNHVYHHLAKITTLCLAIHVYLMAVAAFFPFCAHLLGRYPGNTLAVLIWMGTGWCYVFGLLLLCLAAEKQGLYSPEFDKPHVIRLRNALIRITAVLFVYLVCFRIFHPILLRLDSSP